MCKTSKIIAFILLAQLLQCNYVSCSDKDNNQAQTDDIHIPNHVQYGLGICFSGEAGYHTNIKRNGFFKVGVNLSINIPFNFGVYRNKSRNEMVLLQDIKSIYDFCATIIPSFGYKIFSIGPIVGVKISGIQIFKNSDNIHNVSVVCGAHITLRPIRWLEIYCKYHWNIGVHNITKAVYNDIKYSSHTILVGVAFSLYKRQLYISGGAAFVPFYRKRMVFDEMDMDSKTNLYKQFWRNPSSTQRRNAIDTLDEIISLL